MSLEFIANCQLPTRFGLFTLHGFNQPSTDKEHVVLTMGDVSNGQPVLVRVHSECLTGDCLFSLRCDCGPQLEAAMQKIAQVGRGAIFYLRQEGRGIGLLNKIRAYQLQDTGLDTVQANEHLGFGADMRDYSLLKPMFDHLNIQRVHLMTNNPRKIRALTELGIHIDQRLPHEPGRNSHNSGYLFVKRKKLGHLLTEG